MYVCGKEVLVFIVCQKYHTAGDKAALCLSYLTPEVACTVSIPAKAETHQMLVFNYVNTHSK